MSDSGYKIRYPYHTYFLTFTIVDWVDLLARKHCKDIIIGSLKFCIEKKGFIIYAYVIMSNHIHLVASAKEDSDGLSSIIRDFKKFTSKEMIKWMLGSMKESRRNWMLDIFKRHGLQTYRNETFQIWNHDSHPDLIVDPHKFRQKVNYIHQNPVKAGLVRIADEYIYSSAGNYSGRFDNILEVTIPDIGTSIGMIPS